MVAPPDVTSGSCGPALLMHADRSFGDLFEFLPDERRMRAFNGLEQFRFQFGAVLVQVKRRLAHPDSQPLLLIAVEELDCLLDFGELRDGG